MQIKIQTNKTEGRIFIIECIWCGQLFVVTHQGKGVIGEVDFEKKRAEAVNHTARCLTEYLQRKDKEHAKQTSIGGKPGQ